ncbi:NAD(P)H-quinone oxidoreductase [Zhihengliuella alba]
MSAAVFEGSGGPEVLRIVSRPVPTPAPGEILIRVSAAGLNRADVQQRKGVYPPPPGASDIPGLEVSGTVAARGADVASPAGEYNDGAPVCALLAGGGYAEYVAVPAGQAVPLPSGVDPIDAGGLPEVAATVWSNLVLEAAVRPGEWVLIHGGSGGIGAAGIQIMKAYGAHVAVTGSTREKLDYAAGLGADLLIDYRTEDFAERMREATDGHGADVVLDVVGAKYLGANVSTLATGGRLVVIGLAGGVRGELDLSALMARRGRVIATTLRSRPSAEKAAIMDQVRRHVWPMVSAGRLKPTTDRVFALADAAAAHAYFDSGEHRGKVLLRP